VTAVQKLLKYLLLVAVITGSVAAVGTAILWLKPSEEAKELRQTEKSKKEEQQSYHYR